MLSKLTVKNVALIERAEIDFCEGLNVLSGETGAGKSVILDSVNFVLGAKAERSMIRFGESECMVKAEFIMPETSKAVELLREMDIDTDGEIIISRKFTDAGKNSVKINGSTVTASMVRKITDCLVDVHGQSEHFFLLKESNQLKLLDGVVGQPLEEEKQTLSVYLRQKREIDEQIALLGGDEAERNRRIELLKYQIDEIQAVDLQEGEEDELISKRNKINNLERIISALSEASNALSAEGGALDCMRSAKRALGSVSKLDEAYDKLNDKLESVALDAEDISETLNDFAGELYFDETEAEETEARLDAIKSLKRKYGANKAEIDEYFDKINAEYALLSDCEGQFNALTTQREKLLKKIFVSCKKLTELRKTEGEAFCRRVTDELKTLNIPHAQFEIVFSTYDEADSDKANSNGLDSVCFMFSANAGEPMKPLGKIISGGEMSRFMLAIKTQLSSLGDISTYIFDEIDAGISGKTAKVVGEKLAKIAKNTQIIAVSHLAQISVMSDGQFLIEKQEEDGKTLTKVFSLSTQQKTREIVRLLGGTESDEFAVKHAEELIKQASEYKSAL